MVWSQIKIRTHSAFLRNIQEFTMENNNRIRWWFMATLFLLAGIAGCRHRTSAIVAGQREEKPKPRTTSEWASWGNDLGGMRYARLTEINPDNVSGLEVHLEYI